MEKITVYMDETLKSQLEKLMHELGMNIETFFTLSAKQAVREQALPFHPRIINNSPKMKHDNKIETNYNDIKIDYGRTDRKHVIATNIRYFLNKNQKTKMDLAKYLGVTPSTVTHWTKEKRTPSYDSITMISNFFGVSREEIEINKHY